jgi:undecaprenyl-phosphate 4-deoxy-4-formamido-L-arabinose transferase
MLMLGLLGEYIGKIYMTISNLPQYMVRTEINAPEKKK